MKQPAHTFLAFFSIIILLPCLLFSQTSVLSRNGFDPDSSGQATLSLRSLSFACPDLSGSKGTAISGFGPTDKSGQVWLMLRPHPVGIGKTQHSPFRSSSLLEKDQTAKKPYILQNPTLILLKRIEESGGIVATYRRDKSALVYLYPLLAQRLQSEGLVLRQTKPMAAAVDTLSSGLQIGNRYHNYQAVIGILDSLSALYPHIMRVENIGFTEEGRSIRAVCLSDNVNEREAEPEVCYIAAMHGNEILTQELMLCFIDSLLQNYGSDERITSLLDSTQIWIIPNMNFDGSQSLSRFNANGVDLNRDFPDREYDMLSDTSGRAAETKAIMNWRAKHRFVLAANFHTGELVVNYPWDKNLPGEQGYAATPDDEVFVRLALSYSRENPMLYNNPRFDRGIVNGVLWYAIDGSMQDWAYHWHGTFETTIEISKNIMPPADSIRYYFSQNSASMLSYLEQVHSGIAGTITDVESGQSIAAEVEILGIDKIIPNNPLKGDYYRLLEPGKYDVRISAANYEAREFKDIVVDSGRVTHLDAALTQRSYFIVSGTVLDTMDNQPMEGVQVSLTRYDRIVDLDTTESDGSYALKAEKGLYELVFARKNYFKRSDSLRVEADLKRNIKLLKVIPSIVAGQVVLSDGGSPEGTVVYCQSHTDTLSENAAFRLDSLQGGQIHLFTWQQKYATSHIDTTLGNGDSLWVVITLFPGDNEFYSDFEDSDGGFKALGEWEYGEPIAGPDKAFNGAMLWGTNLDGNYYSGAHKAVLESPILFVQGMVLPQIEFYHWYDFEEKYDGGNLKISVDDGETWQLAHPSPDYPLMALSEQYGNPLGGQAAYSGQNGAWQRVSVDLTQYKNSASLLVRFEAGIDEQKEALGWYIDRFHLYDANATKMMTALREDRNSDPQLSVAPNPANPLTSVRFYLKKKQFVTLNIYNILGQKIKTLYEGEMESGWHSLIWRGRNNAGLPQSSGVYIIRLQIDKKQWKQKFILIR